MKNILLIFSLIFIQNMSFGQNLELPLWPDKIPNRIACNESEKRVTDRITKISNVQEPNIAVFLPAKGNSNGQAVVICPGGGYRILAYDWEGTDIAKMFNSRGIAAIVLKYRLPESSSNITPHLSPLMDAKQAMRLVRSHAEEWNIDKNKVGIMGFSAGGHLASTLGTHFDEGDASAIDSIDKISSRPDFMILGYPVISFSKSCCHQGSVNALIGKNPDPSLIKFYSNELQVKDDTPPTFIFHAGDDPAVPVENSLRFYKALNEKNIPAELHIYPKGKHGFSLAINNEHLGNWVDACMKWMKQLD